MEILGNLGRQKELHRKRMPSILLGCLLLSLVFRPSGLALPSQEKQTQPPLRHEVSVTVKLIQVYVTDKDGKPVTDLTPADFELYDNGRRQAITEFEKHLLPTAEGKGSEPAQPSSLSTSKMNRKFFLFFDFVFNNVRGIEQAKKAARHFIDTQVQLDDEVGVLSYSIYKGLTLHEYLTTSHQKVREVIEGFGSKELLGRANNVEVEYWGALQSVTGDMSVSNPSIASPREGRSGFTPDKLKLQDATIDRMVYQLHARNFTSKLKDLANGLRYIPGNKYLILFSSGIASSVFQGAPVVMDKGKLESALRAGDMTMYNIDSVEAAAWEEKKYENMAKELAEANTLVFSLNTENMGEASQANKAMLGDYALKKISKISGGEYFSNIENYEKNLSDIQNFTSSFYVLGYYIEDRWDGKYHKVKITTKRPGCEVHAQAGYFNPKPFEKYTDLEKTLQLIDLALSENPLLQDPAHFPVIPLSSPGQNENMLLLVSDIPLEGLSLSKSGKVEMITLVFDAQKNIADFKRAEVDLSRVSQKKICYYTISALPPGEYECRVVLRNLKTGQAAVAKSSAVIPAPAKLGFTLFQPLLLVADTNTYFLGVSKARRQEAGGSPSSLLFVYPFAFNEYVPLVERLISGTPTISALVRYSAVLGLKPELKLTGVLKNQSSGQEDVLPASVRSGGEYQTDDKTVKSVVFMIEFQLPPKPEPGAYTLKIMAEERQTQLKTEFVRDIRID